METKTEDQDQTTAGQLTIHARGPSALGLLGALLAARGGMSTNLPSHLKQSAAEEDHRKDWVTLEIDFAAGLHKVLDDILGQDEPKTANITDRLRFLASALVAHRSRKNGWVLPKPGDKVRCVRLDPSRTYLPLEVGKTYTVISQGAGAPNPPLGTSAEQLVTWWNEKTEFGVGLILSDNEPPVYYTVPLSCLEPVIEDTK